MSTGEVRRTVVEARSTDTFGRVLLNARDQHFVIDGPVHNGCPGEAVTPPEAFLAGMAACGVEPLHVIARDENLPLRSVRVDITGEVEPGNPVREGVTVFNRVRLHFELDGVNVWSRVSGSSLASRVVDRSTAASRSRRPIHVSTCRSRADRQCLTI